MTARWRRWLLTTATLVSLVGLPLGAARADDPEPLPADDATLTAQIMGGRTSERGREHLRGRFERDLPAALRRLGVKSLSDCGGCHTRAAEGRFSERELRVPE